MSWSFASMFTAHLSNKKGVLLRHTVGSLKPELLEFCTLIQWRKLCLFLKLLSVNCHIKIMSFLFSPLEVNIGPCPCFMWGYVMYLLHPTPSFSYLHFMLKITFCFLFVPYKSHDLYLFKVLDEMVFSWHSWKKWPSISLWLWLSNFLKQWNISFKRNLTQKSCYTEPKISMWRLWLRWK